MTEETIVAVYDTAAQADAAVRDLEAANIPSSAIVREPSATGGVATATERPVREQGFWSNLFGGDPDHDTGVYESSVASGRHMVTVKVTPALVADATIILERHHPVDLDERPMRAVPGVTETTATTPVQAPGPLAADANGRLGTTLRDNEEAIPLAEEKIDVGKRLVNRGTTRVHRFVLETPVEEKVSLRSERVSVERRPVSGDARVADAAFTDKTVEMTESEEEAVVAKTARVREEVVIRKDASERVETIHDTVRREDVEITNDSKPIPGTPNAGPVNPGIGPEPAVRR